MGLADTIRDTLGVGAHHEEHSAEASHGVVDHRTPGAFPSDTPTTEEQRELSSQSNTTGTTGLAGKEGIRGHAQKDSGVGLSDVTGSHPKTVGQSDLSSSGNSSGMTGLSDVTHSHPQTVGKDTLRDTAAGNTTAPSGGLTFSHSRPQAAEKGALHNTSAANTGVSSGLSDVTHSHPQTVGHDSVRNTAAGNTTGLTDDDDLSRAQAAEKGSLQSHPQTSGSHFHRSDVHMPTNATGTGPSENVDHGSAAGNALASVLGEPHNRYSKGTDKSPISTTGTGGVLGTDPSSHHNTVSQGTGHRSNTGNTESYWGSLPSAAGIYNTVTGNGSGEDTTSQHRHVPAAGDSEVAMQSASRGPEAPVPRGGVYNTVVGHGSSTDDTNRTAQSTTNESGGGLYNTLSGAAAGGYNAAASAAQGLYNTVSRRSGSGTEHEYEHDKPLTTTTSHPGGTGSGVLDPAGVKHQYQHETPATTTGPGVLSTSQVHDNDSPFTTSSSTTAPGIRGTTGGHSGYERDTPLTSSTSPQAGNTSNITGTDIAQGAVGVAAVAAQAAYNGASYAAQGISNAVQSDTAANAAQAVSNTASSAAQGVSNAVTSDTAANAAQTVSNTASNAAQGASNAASNAYQGVSNTASNASQAVSDTVYGDSNTRTGQYEGNKPLSTTTSTTTGTQRAFPLDNSPTTTTFNNRSLASDRDPASTHDHSHTGRNLAGAGAGAVAGKGAYDFLHRKPTDAPDPLNEFVSNENPYNAPTHEGWQHSEPGGLFSDSELKRLSLRQKELDEAALPPQGGFASTSSGTGQTHGLGSGHPSYDTPASLAAAGRLQQSRAADEHLTSGGRGQTHGLGSGSPSSRAGHTEIPIPSRAHQNPLDEQRAEAPRSDHSSNVGAGLAGAGLGAGAAYGASRVARDHHDDKNSATSSGIPSSSVNRSEPMATTPTTHHDTSARGNGGLPIPTSAKHDVVDKHDRRSDDAPSGLQQEKHHKARDVAAFGAGGAAAAGGYDMLSHGDKPSGVRQPGQTAADSPTTTSSTTSPTSMLDDHQRSRAAAGMTGIGPASTAGTGLAGVGAGAVAADTGMNQEGHRQQAQQDTLSRSGGDGHAPLHSTHDKNVKERGTTVPSANAGKKDPYNHLSSGTPSGVSM
ncbi:cytochrome P450 4V3 [Apiospora arundinis]